MLKRINGRSASLLAGVKTRLLDVAGVGDLHLLQTKDLVASLPDHPLQATCPVRGQSTDQS